MKKILSIFVICILASPLFANAVISKMTGKVEIMRSGSTIWEKAEPGMEIPMDCRISTGFNSTATILINGSSEVQLKALTRIKVEDISQQSGGSQSTRLFMGNGRMSANVKKSEGQVHDFRVRTPVATAAVRGTQFDMTPNALKVKEGIVQFTVGKFSFAVSQGQSSTVILKNGETGIVTPIAEVIRTRVVQTTTGFTNVTEEAITNPATGTRTGYASVELR